MPIRFRCAYCNQLMGISHRKAGTVVRCPKCAGQVVVPEDASSPEPDAPPGPDVPNLLEDPELELLLAGAAKDVGGPKAKPRRKTSKLFPEVDVEPLDPPARQNIPPIPAPTPVPSAPPSTSPSSSSSAMQASLQGLLIPHNVLMVGGVVVVVLIGAAFLFGYYVGRGL